MLSAYACARTGGAQSVRWNTLLVYDVHLLHYGVYICYCYGIDEKCNHKMEIIVLTKRDFELRILCTGCACVRSIYLLRFLR